MTVSLSPSEEFIKKIESLVIPSKSKSGFILDEELNCSKKTVFWCLRWQVQWIHQKISDLFFSLCGIRVELFPLTRVEKVVSKILILCQENYEVLQDNAELRENIRTILLNLQERTHCQYEFRDFLNFVDDHRNLSIPEICDPRTSWRNSVSIEDTICSMTSIHLKIPSNDRTKIGIFQELSLPTDESLLGVSRVQKEQLAIVINRVVRQILLQSFLNPSFSYQVKVDKTSSCIKLCIQRVDPSQGTSSLVTSLQSPLPIHFVIAENVIVRVFVITKNVIGKGGERKVRSVWDATKGNWYAIKKCTTELERHLVDVFSKESRRGLPSYITWRDKVKEKGCQMIEPYYAGTFSLLMGNGALDDPLRKCQVIEDLLEGLAFVHAYTVPEYSFECESEMHTEKNVAAYLGDINPANILVGICPDEEDSKVTRWTMIFSDLGLACRLDKPGLTEGWASPEFMRFFLDTHTLQGDVDFHKEYGQKKDVWAFGLLMVCILVGNTSTKVTTQIAPLTFLENYFIEKFNSPGSKSKGLRDKDITNLTQEVVDSDLKKCQDSHMISRNHHASLLAGLRDLARKMLQVDSNKRITSEIALEEFLVLKCTKPYIN